MTVDSTLLDDYGDWHARIALKADTNILMKATIARGTPYIFFENVKGKPTIGRNIDNPNSRFSIFYEKNNVIAFKNESTKEYWVLCLPEGATYELKDKQPGELGPFFKNCIVDLNGKNYFSIGLLFDSCKTENEIKTIAKYAFSVIRDTRVNWKYVSTKNTITTNYKFYTKSFDGVNADSTLMVLFPHQYNNLNKSYPFNKIKYPHVKGWLKTIEGNNFSTTLNVPGFLFQFPKVLDSTSKSFN